MPIIHTNWAVLRDKLLKIDPPHVDRRCGNRTLVFELDELELDPKIPILSASKLHKWVKHRNSSSSSTNLSPALDRQETPQKAGPLSSKKAKPIKQNLIPKKPEQLPPSSPQLSPPSSSVEEQDQTSQDGSQSSRASSVPIPASEATVLWKCNVDALVISETMNDEFAIYANDDDDDDNETEFTRNRKKIRTTAPQAPKPPQVNRITPRAKSPTPPPEVSYPPPQEPPPPPPPPPKPRQPNWEETAKLLQGNEINTVFRDLDYFKVQAKSEVAARNILKDLVTKCVRDDETRLLQDILNLVFELGFEDDNAFWSELVLRFKRKLGNHGVAAFKNKTNPEIIYENYRRAMLSISQYAKSVNLEVKLPFSGMTFLIDPVNNCERVWAPEHEPINSTIKVEKQENISPMRVDRRVTVGAKTMSGRINFKVSKPRTGTILKQRL